MTNTFVISCVLDTTDPTAELGFEAWVDDHRFFDTDHVQSRQQICFEISDDDASHELRFVLKNKIESHTKIDDNGVILSDARLIITDIAFDQIPLGHTFTEQASYWHDFNGTGQMSQQKFYGEIGCNGTIELKFSTPIYMWLLEHM